MRISRLFGKTQREIPAEADIISHQLLLRAGMIRQVAAGVYSYLPLAWRALRKIENIIRDEMDKVGGQELMMPVLQPLELWQESGRDQAFGQGMFRLTDRRDRCERPDRRLPVCGQTPCCENRRRGPAQPKSLTGGAWA